MRKRFGGREGGRCEEIFLYWHGEGGWEGDLRGQSCFDGAVIWSLFLERRPVQRKDSTNFRMDQVQVNQRPETHCNPNTKLQRAPRTFSPFRFLYMAF